MKPPRSPNLQKRQAVLLTLVQTFDGRCGNLDFQKRLFLYCQECGGSAPYDFVPYRFGAFSFSSYADRRRLVERGLLEKDDNYWILSESGRTVLDQYPAMGGSLSGFAQRYGFRDKPQRIRFRLLDPAHAPSPWFRDSDITLDAASFARLEPSVSRIFITENETNFLAFPPVKDSLIVFGGGYGIDVLARAAWIARCQVHYWGDIDTHGFAILDQLRAHLPDAHSLLMDRATLLAFEAHWGEEERQTLRDLPRLNDNEQALYDELRDNRLRPRLRLEQERIGFGWVERSLANGSFG